MPSVLLVDDHPLFRLGVATLLEREQDFQVVGHAATVAEALELDATLRPDLVVMDVLLNDESGIDLARRLRAMRDVHILGLSVLDEPVRIVEMIRAGASGYALKIQTFEEILEAMRSALAGQRYLAPAIREQVEEIAAEDRKLPLERLTAREREIFELLVEGYSNAQIGEQLAIAPRTVDTHRQRILKKLGAHSIADLVRFAARWGALS